MTVFKVGKNDTKWLNPSCMTDSDFLDLSLFGFGHWEFSHCVFNWKEEGKGTKSQCYTIFTIVTGIKAFNDPVWVSKSSGHIN
jgi:hypothetical protein